ncbi:MAG: PEGA domain-containing protein [Spirochaetaceae bacterium]|nr:PEGA domain-containing protein [Spirochaetaceae bacterium]
MIDKTTHNTEWKLCITEFDVSGLPKARQALGLVVARNLVANFHGFKFKLRDNNEYDYYWTAAWMKNQHDAAQKIMEKQAQRDKLLFSGDADWKNAAQRRKLDREIDELRLTLDDAELESPTVAEKPRFSVTQDNRAGIFPQQPKTGSEYFLCFTQQTDGLVMGKITEYHGRILVELRLWTIWTRSFSYEDKALFSLEDIDLALSEFSARLINTLSGMKSSTLIVQAQPENAVIIVDDRHAGRGNSEEIDHTPGPVEVTVYAENHITATEKIELREGERTTAQFNLKPIPVETVTIAATGDETANVYSEGLFLGTAPHKITGPLGQYRQINMETESGTTAQTLFRIDASAKPHILTPKTPPLHGRTEKARKSFYGALGRFWFIAPAAFFSAGLSNSMVDSFNAPSAFRTQERLDEANTWYTISMGFMIAAGVSLLEVFIRLGIYLYQGSKDGTIIVPKEKPAPVELPVALEEPQAVPEALPTTEGSEEAAPAAGLTTENGGQHGALEK